MTNSEIKCVDILTNMVESDGLIGIKTSFEDEGALFNDIVKLKTICNFAKTPITLKIGGPEAIRDLKESTILGVYGVVAPMVESSFGLHKFLSAVKNNISKEDIKSLHLNINIETISAVNSIDDILNCVDIDMLDGITVGRVDLVSSMGKDRAYVNDEELYDMIKKVFIKVKEKNLKACIGGAVSIESYDFLQRLNSEGLLDKFETRYAMYNPNVALNNFTKALYNGQLFEYEWLLNKRNYYLNLANQDNARIQMIQNRINESQPDGGFL
jgi:hypothetical protein